MPKYRNRTARIIFFQTRKYLGSNKYYSGDIPGKQLTFSKSSSDDDVFEELMEVQSECFNDIQNGANIDNFDFSKLIALLNGLNPKFNDMKNFLLDTLTIVNLSRLYNNKAVNLAKQLKILQDEYEKLLGKYKWLEEHCGELEEEEEAQTNLTFCTKVEVDMDMVYLLYQHFFGYPEDGIWDEEKANMIRKHLQNKEINTLKEDGSVIKIRHKDDPIKIELQNAPSAVLEIKLGNPTSIGDDTIITNILEAHGTTEVNYGLKIGQQLIIDYGGEHPETRICIGFGSIIINKPLEFPHLPGSIIMIVAQGGTKYLSGIIVKVNGKFESYDIQLDIGGVVKGVRELVIEDGKIEDSCPHDDHTFDNNIPTGILCPQCGGDTCSCNCETCGETLNNCSCNI
jgi:hypothetical protein